MLKKNRCTKVKHNLKQGNIWAMLKHEHLFYSKLCNYASEFKLYINCYMFMFFQINGECCQF